MQTTSNMLYLKLCVLSLAGFVQGLEILETPWISKNCFPGLESPGIFMQILESHGNLNWSHFFHWNKKILARLNKIPYFLSKYNPVDFLQYHSTKRTSKCVVSMKVCDRFLLFVPGKLRISHGIFLGWWCTNPALVSV